MDVAISNRVDFVDRRQGPPGVASVMVTFQAPDGRMGVVILEKSRHNPITEKTAIDLWLTAHPSRVT